MRILGAIVGLLLTLPDLPKGARERKEHDRPRAAGLLIGLWLRKEVFGSCIGYGLPTRTSRSSWKSAG